jgi:hypothetical protein
VQNHLAFQLGGIISRAQRSFKSKLFAASCVLVAFAGGYVVAHFFRPTIQAQVTTVPPTDYRIELPEGRTIITVTDPRAETEQPLQFIVERRGKEITGIPQTQQHIAPRRRLSSEDAAFFRRELAGIILPTDSPWQRANRIREWLANSQHAMALPGLATRVPREAYEEMRHGRPVLCGNLAEIYVALCEAAGLVGRAVGMSFMVRDGTFGSDTHAAAEIWLPELGGWVYEDPTFNCYWEVDGKPASALSLHEALMTGREIRFASENPQAEAAVKAYYIDPRLFFRHISYEYRAGGPVLYYVDGRLEPLNMREKNWIQTDDKKDIERLDTDGNTILERRGEVAPGIFAQLIGDDLYVRDRREQMRGIRVRSSSSPVHACPYEHWRAEELGLFNNANLVRNSEFNITGQSDSIAADWSTSGPVEALTVMGGQGMAALSGGKLWQRVEVRAGARYLMYVKINVTRGIVTWSVADVARGMKSSGTVKQSQISEIVSDVVESKSGYLDVAFEVPEGGGFRVMNVVVAELPTADQQYSASEGLRVSRR